MTQQEWLECTDPQPMLELLEGKASERKLRLLACACCRRIWHLLKDKRSREAIGIAERFADGRCDEEEVGASVDAACDAAHDIGVLSQADTKEAASKAADAAVWCASIYYSNAMQYAMINAEAAAKAAGANQNARSAIESSSQTDLLRDIFGNPFRPVSIDASRLTPTVTALAQSIYDERTFDRLPTLADELERAGCDNRDVLEHCRGPGPHMRGCWALDLVLRKQ